MDASSTPPSARRSTGAGTGRRSRHLPAERSGTGCVVPLAAAARRSARARRAHRPCTSRCRPRRPAGWPGAIGSRGIATGSTTHCGHAQDAVLAVAGADQRFAAASMPRVMPAGAGTSQTCGSAQATGRSVVSGVVSSSIRNIAGMRDHVGDVHRVHRGHHGEDQGDDAGQPAPAEREPRQRSEHGLRSERQRHVGRDPVRRPIRTQLRDQRRAEEPQPSAPRRSARRRSPATGKGGERTRTSAHHQTYRSFCEDLAAA